MISFPNAKINLGLDILSRRPDGYHTISSLFYPIPWCDVLEIIPASNLKFSSSGIPIPGDSTQNLCVKAFDLLQAEYKIAPVHIHLHKVIPIGAGLGGGSADGAFAISMLNSLFDLKMSTKEMEQKAGLLGSDCPFFIQNQPQLVSGTGNVFADTSIDLSGMHILLIYPRIHVSTKEAYAGITPATPAVPVGDIVQKPMQEWKNLLKNDFEKTVGALHPKILQLKEQLYAQGAVYAAMSGSGSAVFGLFEQPIAPDQLHQYANDHLIWSGQLP